MLQKCKIQPYWIGVNKKSSYTIKTNWKKFVFGYITLLELLFHVQFIELKQLYTPEIVEFWIAYKRSFPIQLMFTKSISADLIFCYVALLLLAWFSDWWYDLLTLTTYSSLRGDFCTTTIYNNYITLLTWSKTHVVGPTPYK
jgi:hypothetical protein